MPCVCDQVSLPPCFYCRDPKTPEERAAAVAEGIGRSLAQGAEKMSKLQMEKLMKKLRKRKEGAKVKPPPATRRKK